MRGLADKTIELILFARQLLAALHPMNLRQLHYAIFSAAILAYENTQTDYRRLSRVTTDARRWHRQTELYGEHKYSEYGIPHAWMVDELREGEMVSCWQDVSGYMDTVKGSYRRDNWQDQPAYCEVWSEKAASLATLRPVTRELGVTLRVCRGFGSTGMEGQIGYLFEDIEKPIHIFYLGDFDPSGEDIERDIHRRAQVASGKEFTIERLAIFAEDIQKFNLPPQKIKEKDTRRFGFRKRHGENAATVELDALPVDELRARVRKAIERLIDWERWNRQVMIQDTEQRSIEDIVARIKALPRQNRIAPE